ncbi:beta-ketoacyl-ACP reductase [Kocuria dechangensis]|uniref:Beta-ketoacyl-ACP reductase n=1 Tax=Kocuria dechangensis TaxID=1176249 RepID=A0A917GJE0_9MICC|nr:3-oxoacyl-ACP reductase family protein [Kocuria dechangensis]GGG48580.1 beta-ketoacyl-ACP reductase [Kocuria dechangensis]
MNAISKGDRLGTSRLDGRVALVTGGTRGIGAAICRSFASQGAVVAAGYSGNDEAAQEFLGELRETYPDGTFSVHKGNVGQPEDCRRVVAEVLEQHGRLDILVNNAGITLDKTFLKMTDDEWHKVIDVNLSGAFFMSQAALRHMLERGTGRVVNVSSIVGEIGNIGQTNYAASKAGLFGMSKSLAREVSFLLKRSGKLDAGVGLTINTVSPGVVDTEMVQAIPEAIRNNLYDQIPAHRFADPEEIARAVHFLAADESSFITGQVLSVNGGMDM